MLNSEVTMQHFLAALVVQAGGEVTIQKDVIDAMGNDYEIAMDGNGVRLRVVACSTKSRKSQGKEKA